LRKKEVGLLRCDFHDDFKETIQDHESRIRELEIKSAKVLEKMDAVCRDLQSVTAWIKTLMGFWLTSMVGFFIWYIQSLPR